MRRAAASRCEGKREVPHVLVQDPPLRRKSFAAHRSFSKRWSVQAQCRRLVDCGSLDNFWMRSLDGGDYLAEMHRSIYGRACWIKAEMM